MASVSIVEPSVFSPPITLSKQISFVCSLSVYSVFLLFVSFVIMSVILCILFVHPFCCGLSWGFFFSAAKENNGGPW